MTLSKLLKELVDAFGYLPYGRLELTWHQHLALWDAGFSYWSIRPGLKEHPWGRTPEEATRKLVGQLKGQELYRTGQNGNWGSYTVEEEVVCDDVALAAPKEPPPLAEGYNEVLKERALDLAMTAEKVFVKTYIGDRPLKGYPEDKLLDKDQGGKGFALLLECIKRQNDSCPVEVGVYDGGKMVGFRGGIF